jgi:hypothetical protein
MEFAIRQLPITHLSARIRCRNMPLLGSLPALDDVVAIDMVLLTELEVH